MKTPFAAGNLSATCHLLTGTRVVQLELHDLGVLVSDVTVRGRRRFYISVVPIGPNAEWLGAMRAFEVGAN